MPRDRARMVPVRTVGKAWGRTMCQMVCQRVAPSAKDAWRRELGTARSASWVVMIIMGMMSRLMVRAPESMLRSSARARTKIARPSMPYTMEGTPARLVMLIWITRVIQCLGAYSSR